MLRLSEFDYNLPEEKIALFPLQKRDESKLLVYQNGTISHNHFYDLAELLNENDILVFNNTKVIHARLIFKRKTGGEVELLCLEPLAPEVEISRAMTVKGQATWLCMAGN